MIKKNSKTNLLRITSRALRFTGRKLNAASDWIANSQGQSTPALLQWFEDKGDKTLRLFYENLNESSLVFDVGGYEGQWASDIFSIHQPNIYLFEPVPAFFEFIDRRFRKNPKIKAFPFGLGGVSRTMEINVNKNSSSFYRKMGNQNQVVNIVGASEFLTKYSIKKIDLMKINIEGGEYELLEHLIEKDFIKNIANIQIQFHTFIDGYAEKMKDIQEALSKTHSLTYQYPMIWENWCCNL